MVPTATDHTVQSPAEPFRIGNVSTAASDENAARVDLANVLDIATLLFALQNEQQGTQESQQEATIRAEAAAVRTAIDRARQAAEQARESSQKSSLWSDIGATAKLVAAVATVTAGVAGSVATGGLSLVSSLAIAGALVSLTAKPVVESLGGNDTMAFWVGMSGAALSLSGGVVGFLGTSAEVGGHTAIDVAARYAQAGAIGVGGAATGVAGYAQMRAGSATAESVDAQADGLEARARQRVSEAEAQELIAALKGLDESFQRAKSSILDAQHDMSGTMNLLLTTSRN